MDKRNLRKINLPIRYCIICKKPIIRNTTQSKKRISPKQYLKAKFCSYKCRGKWLSINYIGEKSPNWKGGVPNCIICGGKLGKGTWHKIGFNKRCLSCWHKLLRKNPELTPNWKGERVIRIPWKWKQYRETIFKRDKYICQLCGNNKGHNLIVHHIFGFTEYPKYRYDTIFGITLCEKCHKKIHAKIKL